MVPDTEPVDPAALPARIGCTLPQVFEDVEVGHRIYFDDGALGGVVEEVRPDRLRVRITDAAPQGTDAAMSGRAECVKLNKGPYIDRAVAFLDDLLSRMAEHQHKKVSLLRRLRAWEEPEAPREVFAGADWSAAERTL